MSKILDCRMKGYIQPFERHLALAELSKIAKAEPSVRAGTPELYRIAVPNKFDHNKLLAQLAYWECVRREDGKEELTTQVIRERTANVVRNGIPLAEIPALLQKASTRSLPNRRCLRYGTHGIHEYRGKFFPQLVRSLINVGEVPARGIVADPMCGSGTTLVEGVLGNYRALGLDMNPLSVFMSRTKCSLLSVSPDRLATAYEDIRASLLHPSRKQRTRMLSYFSQLPAEDQKYLRSWFSEQVIDDLDQVASAIRDLDDDIVRDFMTLGLSNILRRVSWQKDDDLRVRKEVRLDVDIDPVREFLEEVGRSVRLALAFLYRSERRKIGHCAVSEADATDVTAVWKRWVGKIDAVITSPPYATALPYLDTDRLSLSYLRFLSRPHHRNRDQLMIGNREISEKTRKAYWLKFQRQRTSLPVSIVQLIDTVHNLNDGTDVGFRRRNLPALLSKYFMDMEEVFRGIKTVLAPGSPAFVVVGNNHTIAGGQRTNIDTPNLLCDLAESVGLRTEGKIPMEMLVSRDIFKKNAVSSEEILCLRKPK